MAVQKFGEESGKLVHEELGHGLVQLPLGMEKEL